MGDIVSLKYDDGFKQLFFNEEVRRYFISDALGIPVEEIRSVRLANTFLWKQFRWQKQGILEVLLELNGDSRINVELQIKMLAYWDKRSIFYVSKLFTENVRVGQDYTKLKRCVCISILGFNLDDKSKYHRIYRLRDEDGEEYSDLIEIQVIELNKMLNGKSRLDDWIRLFNAKTKEELDMLEAKTKNRGILEAIKEVRVMSLGQKWKMMYDARMKQIRDQHAREDYVREEGRTAGREEGREEGREITIVRLVQRKLQKGKTLEEIAEELEETLENVERIRDAIQSCESDDVEEIHRFMKRH